MNLKQLQTWIDSLPIEFLEFNIVSSEEIKSFTDDDIIYRLDKPIISLAVNENNREILFINIEKYMKK
jgi:hypothetical protein